uniref:Uncharacterized protein n=1 Tax=Ditylenchus dipsaci TaxID=166011 RepID=A0A915DSN9_9BILA
MYPFAWFIASFPWHIQYNEAIFSQLTRLAAAAIISTSHLRHLINPALPPPPAYQNASAGTFFFDWLLRRQRREHWSGQKRECNWIFSQET